MTASWTPAAVHAAAAAWRWTPYDAVTVRTRSVDLVVSGGTARVHRAVAPAGAEPAALVTEVRRLARQTGAIGVTWVVADHDTSVGLSEVLAAAGSTVTEELTLMARPLAAGVLPDPAVRGAQIRRVDTPELLEAAYALDSALLGTPVRSTQFRRVAAAKLAEQVAAGADRTAYRFVALVNGGPPRGGTVVGTAGLTLAGEVARLWGAAVLPRQQGRGLYRALLGVRLRQAAAAGATLALAKARVGSSAPILRRYGFSRYGSERHYQLAT